MFSDILDRRYTHSVNYAIKAYYGYSISWVIGTCYPDAMKLCLKNHQNGSNTTYPSVMESSSRWGPKPLALTFRHHVEKCSRRTPWRPWQRQPILIFLTEFFDLKSDFVLWGRNVKEIKFPEWVILRRCFGTFSSAEETRLFLLELICCILFGHLFFRFCFYWRLDHPFLNLLIFYHVHESRLLGFNPFPHWWRGEWRIFFT